MKVPFKERREGRGLNMERCLQEQIRESRKLKVEWSKPNKLHCFFCCFVEGTPYRAFGGLHQQDAASPPQQRVCVRVLFVKDIYDSLLESTYIELLGSVLILSESLSSVVSEKSNPPWAPFKWRNSLARFLVDIIEMLPLHKAIH